MTSTPNIRIAAIDATTGYVWGESCITRDLADRASDLTLMQGAATQILQEADGSRRYESDWFEECSQRDAAALLHLYEIADDEFELTDGQDKEQIAHVEDGRYIGSVRYVPQDD